MSLVRIVFMDAVNGREPRSSTVDTSEIYDQELVLRYRGFATSPICSLRSVFATKTTKFSQSFFRLSELNNILVVRWYRIFTLCVD